MPITVLDVIDNFFARDSEADVARLPGRRLYDLGMVNKVVPDDQLMAAAREYAERFVSLPQEVLRKTKELMLKTRQWPRGEVKEEHIRSQEWLSSRPDTKEAVRAFVEKRQAKFVADGRQA